MKINKIISYAIILVLSLPIACVETEFGPVLEDPSTFVAPVFKNSASAPPVELLPEDADEEYEMFEWDKTDYGIQLSTDYVLEMDDNDEFSDPKILAQTSGSSVSVSVEDMNNTMLSLGVPGFEESTVFIRVKSTLNGHASDPLYSAVIERTATTYQISDCGNFCTIGLIGNASPGLWDVDVDMRLADATRVDKNTWTLTVYLNTGAVKFRASDNWDTNWGATDFPSGTGTQNGPDIPIATAGYYKITFNDSSGDYTFTLISTTFTTVGIIGSGTAGGWDSDTDLTQDPNDAHVWTGVVTLTDGEAKFRANDDWAANWGETTYPSGYGIGNGPNIPVSAGTYFVRFNDASGQYMIMAQNKSTPYGSLGVVGPAQAGGWDADTDLVKNPANPFIWSKILVLSEGDAKFRADDAWTANWGASPFPQGVGIQDGPNIPVKEGTYFITFNTGTGEYFFLK